MSSLYFFLLRVKMGEIKEMFEKYLREGLPEEVAVARVVAHNFTQSPPPGVEWEILHYARLAVKIRNDLIDNVPERYKSAVRQLLAHTKDIDSELVDSRAFYCFHPSDWPEGKYNLSIYDAPHMVYIASSGCRANEPSCTDPDDFPEYEIVVPTGEMAVLISTRDDEETVYDPIVMSPGPFRVVGILTKKECYNLKVDRSEEGWKATQALVRMLGGY